jgi:hypothetical protein
MYGDEIHGWSRGSDWHFRDVLIGSRYRFSKQIKEVKKQLDLIDMSCKYFESAMRLFFFFILFSGMYFNSYGQQGMTLFNKSAWDKAITLKERREKEGLIEVRRRVISVPDLAGPVLLIEKYSIRGAKRELVGRNAFAADHILGTPRRDIERERALSELKEQGINSIPVSHSDFLVIQCPVEVDGVTQMINKLSGPETLFSSLEPDHIIYGTATPNDPDYSKQWQLQAGDAGGCIDAPAAWDLATNGSGVMIGVLDSGTHLGHPDLVGNLWSNPADSTIDGKDNDLNGYKDDCRGYNFVNESLQPEDDHGHGTHVAGIIGAMTNTTPRKGVAGVCWTAQLVSLKILNGENKLGYCSHAVRALRYCLKIRCRIANNSWSLDYGEDPSCLRSAVDASRAAGMLLICAAQNKNASLDQYRYYPACYTHENIITVTSNNPKGELHKLRAWGSTMVDLAAPGEKIWSSWISGGYACDSGTSMATPHVTGTCALMMTKWPDKKYDWIKQKLIQGVTPDSSLSGKTVSGGRLNTKKALK